MGKLFSSKYCLNIYFSDSVNLNGAIFVPAAKSDALKKWLKIHLYFEKYC